MDQEKIFEVDSGTLRQALKRISPAVDTREGTTPATAYVMIEATGSRVTMTAVRFNPKLMSCTSILDGAEAHNDGRVCLRFVQLYNFANLVSGKIDVSKTRPGGAKVKAGEIEIELPGIDPDDFLISGADFVHDIPDAVSFNQPPDWLEKLTRAAACCASREDIRSAIQGVLFETENHASRIVSTDGKRLLVMEGENILFDDATMSIIPAAAIRAMETAFFGEFPAASEFSITAGKQSWTVSRGGVAFRFTLIEAIYPNYRSVIPERQCEIAELTTEDLGYLLKLARLTNADTAYFSAREQKVFVRSQSSLGVVVGSVPAPMDDITVLDEVSLSPTLLAPATMLQGILTMKAAEEEPQRSQIVFEGDDGKFIIMPMRTWGV